MKYEKDNLYYDTSYIIIARAGPTARTNKRYVKR